LARFELRAHGREFHMNLPIEGAEHPLAVRRDAAASQFPCHHHGGQGSVARWTCLIELIGASNNGEGYYEALQDVF